MRTQCTAKPGCLKMKWELGRWGAQWPQSQVDSDQIKRNYQSDPLKIAGEPARESNLRIQHQQLKGQLAQESGKAERLGEGVSQKLPENTLRDHLNCCPELPPSPSHCSNEPLLDRIVITHVLKSGLCAPTGQIALRGKKIHSHCWVVELSEPWGTHTTWEECSADPCDPCGATTPAAGVGY